MWKIVRPDYSSAKIINIKRVFPELWSQMYCHVFGWPFVKQFALCYQTVVRLSCPVCLSVCDVHALWPNCWTDQDETRHAGRPRLWPYWPSTPNFQSMFIIVIVISLKHCTMHSHYWFVQVLVLVFCVFYFLKKSLIVLSLFLYALLHHIAPIAEVGVAN